MTIRETRVRGRTAGRLAIAVVMVVGGGCAGLVRSGAPGNGGLEAAVFTAVATRLRTDVAGVPLQIDPRPLSDDPSLVEATPRLAAMAPDLVSTPTTVFARVPAAVAERRRRVLERMGIVAGDVLRYADCPGGLVPPGQPPIVHPGCPDTPHVEAVAGLSRAGGAYLPGSRVDERDRAKLGYRAVRVIRRELRPTGATQTAYDFVLARTGREGWEVVRIVPLVIAE